MDAFYALAEPNRRHIIEMLATRGQLTATDICRKFEVSAPAISQHLKVLREANLVQMEKRGQQRIYRINPEAMIQFEGWARQLMELWTQRFDAFDAVLMAEKEKMVEKQKKSIRNVKVKPKK